MIKRLALLLLLCAAPAAQAHYLWLEAPKGAPVLYFGEYDEHLHERSPGRLDDIRSPQAWSLDKGARRAMPLERREDRFVARERARAVIVEELAHPVRDWTQYGIGVVKPLFYARYAPTAARTQPVLPLDVVPAADAFGRVAVHFRGKPLPRAKVEIYAPNGWKQEFRADEAGEVALKLPWPGQYVIEVTHIEKAPGEFEGTKFEAQRHRATLAFRR